MSGGNFGTFLDWLSHSVMGFFYKKNILITGNVAEKNILILVEEKKNNLIPSFCLRATKKKYSNSCVVRKINSERNKKP
jgi:hypothetical protein